MSETEGVPSQPGRLIHPILGVIRTPRMLALCLGFPVFVATRLVAQSLPTEADGRALDLLVRWLWPVVSAALVGYAAYIKSSTKNTLQIEQLKTDMEKKANHEAVNLQFDRVLDRLNEFRDDFKELKRNVSRAIGKGADDAL